MGGMTNTAEMVCDYCEQPLSMVYRGGTEIHFEGNDMEAFHVKCREMWNETRAAEATYEVYRKKVEQAIISDPGYLADLARRARELNGDTPRP